ncbi:MAG: TIM barrel protein [Roseiflexaceae bacterium]|nr:TIM barrel protein [Roseiflexaceae bacterium]
MSIAIASYAFHGLLRNGTIDLFGYLESCRYRYDLRTADIWNGMLTSTEDAYLAKVKQALDERELTLENLCVDGPHIWEDDPAVREQHYQKALTYLHVAEVLGARTLRIDAGVREPSFTSEQLHWIVRRFQEYAQRAHESGFRVGPENHWGAEVVPENMKQICEAVAHPGFGVLLHFRGNAGDALMAPWAMHTHISWEITENQLEPSLTMLHDTGYTGCWSVEHHSGQNEYSEVAVQLAKVRDLLGRW